MTYVLIFILAPVVVAAILVGIIRFNAWWSNRDDLA